MSCFQFTCPSCKQVLECDDSLENQVTACPSCNSEIILTRKPSLIRVLSPEDASLSAQPANGHPEVAVSAPKQRLFYILLGLFLGNIGAHNFFAGYYKEAIVQLGCTIAAIVVPDIGGVRGSGTLLLGAVSVWALVNIIVRKNDADGHPMA